MLKQTPVYQNQQCDQQCELQKLVCCIKQHGLDVTPRVHPWALVAHDPVACLLLFPSWFSAYNVLPGVCKRQYMKRHTGRGATTICSLTLATVPPPLTFPITRPIQGQTV